MHLTYQKVFGALGGVISLGLTIFLAIHLGTPGHPMGLGLSILVVLVTYVCYGLGAAIGSALDSHRSSRTRSVHPEPPKHFEP